ncbi:MAG: tyrosine-type recombinase/integrase [Acidimicrobiales bacterium]
MRGSLRRKGDGRWQVRVYLGKDPTTGKIRLKERTVQGTKREAERVLGELLARAQDGSLPDPRGITMAELLKRWLELNESDFSPKTVLEVRGVIKRTVVPLIGDRLVSEVTTGDLDAFYQVLRTSGGKSGGLAPATIRRIHGIVRRALTQAVRWDMIRTNPAVGASPPRVPKPDIRPPSSNQVADIFAVATEQSPDFATFVLCAASSGARRGELLALRWKDIDFASGTLVISHGLVMSEAGPIEKDTKTHQVRRLSLDQFTLHSLHDQLERRSALAQGLGTSVSPDSFVFSSSADGAEPWYPNSISRMFRKLADAANAHDVRLHDLRHYVASQLMAAGVDVRTVAGRLGHRDPSTTLNVYAKARELQQVNEEALLA